MFSYEDRLRAVQLYIRLGKRLGLTIRQLGYPTKNALKTWYREYEQRHDLRVGYTRRSKFSQAQKERAVEHCLDLELVRVTLPAHTNLRLRHCEWLEGVYKRLGDSNQLEPVAELDGSGNVVASFVYADRANTPSLMLKGGKTYRVIADHLGSVRLVIDIATGDIAQRMEYDEYGNVVQDTNPGFQPFGYAGGIYDRDIGLTRFGARDYDPISGRWTAKDPIGFGSGSANHFAYNGNDSINYVDPSGLEAEIVVWQPVGWGASSFGHVSGQVNGRNYSFGPGGWDTNASFEKYVDRQREFRSGVGHDLNLTPAEEQEFEQCLQNWSAEYDTTNENCGTPFKDCLNMIGKGIGAPLFPTDIGDALLQSPVLKSTNHYQGPQRSWWRDNWFAQ